MEAKKPVPKHDLDNRSEQLDPTNRKFWLERGKSPEESQKRARRATLAAKKETKVGK